MTTCHAIVIVRNQRLKIHEKRMLCTPQHCCAATSRDQPTFQHELSDTFRCCASNNTSPKPLLRKQVATRICMRLMICLGFLHSGRSVSLKHSPNLARSHYLLLARPTNPLQSTNTRLPVMRKGAQCSLLWTLHVDRGIVTLFVFLQPTN